MTLPSYAMNQASFPEMYERWLVGPLFRPWAELTLDEVKLSPGDRLLDIACGTGIVARVAKERPATPATLPAPTSVRTCLLLLAPSHRISTGAKATPLPCLSVKASSLTLFELRTNLATASERE